MQETNNTTLNAKNKSYKLTVVGLLLLLVASSSITILFAYQNHLTKKQNLKIPAEQKLTPLPSPTPTPSPAPKKYINFIDIECNLSKTYCVNREYSGKNVSLVLIPRSSPGKPKIIDTYPFINKLTHSFFINDYQIMYTINNNQDMFKKIIYDLDEDKKTELKTSEEKQIFDVTNDGWFIYSKGVEEKNQYWMEKNQKTIQLGTTPGGMEGVSPSGKYGTLINHFPVKTTEGIGKNKVIGYWSFAVFPIEENGIQKAVYLGDVPYSSGGITQPIDRLYSHWKNHETQIKCSNFFTNSDFFTNPLAE